MGTKRRRIFWFSFVGSIVLLVALVASNVRILFFTPWLAIGHGRFGFASGGWGQGWLGVLYEQVPFYERMRFIIGLEAPWFDYNGPIGRGVVLLIPLVYPLLFLAVLAWFTRKPVVQEGHCRCGYDLTGNVSGVCPECGAAVLPEGQP